MKAETLETVIKLFTVIGSALGAFAFFQNLSKEASTSNKDKWQKVLAIINSNDLDLLKYQIVRRHIESETYSKLKRLVWAIERKDLDLSFKSIFKNRINNKLIHIKSLYYALLEYIQAPYWNPDREGGYMFNKEAFYSKGDAEDWTEDDYINAGNRYADHLADVEDLITKMEETFIQIQSLANRDSYEYILPWKWFQ